MNKRQKLRFSTPDNSFNLNTDQTIVEEKDSSIVIPPKDSIFEVAESNFSELSFSNKVKEYSEDSQISNFSNNSIDLDPVQNTSCMKVSFWSLFINKFYKYKHHISYFLILIIFIVSTKRPSEYNNLIKEIEHLKNRQVNHSKLKNIANLSNGTTIVDHSDCYKFGFFLSKITDKNSIFESNSECFALKSNTGYFTIRLRRAKTISKIAFYHPDIANKESAIKDFYILIGNRKFVFRFDGNGYQEFYFNENITVDENDSIKLIFVNNHGEKRYTCIYRIYIYTITK